MPQDLMDHKLTVIGRDAVTKPSPELFKQLQYNCFKGSYGIALS